MSWTVLWKPRAVKERERLDARARKRIVEAIERYAETGVGDVKPLTGSLRGEFRLKVGKWRVRFRLEEDSGILRVLHVLPRDKVYLVREVPNSFVTSEVAVTTATFDDDEMRVGLSDARTISVPLAWYPRLLDGTPEQRGNWELIGDGEGIHWPDVDEDLSVRGFLRGARAPGAKE